MKSKIYSNFDEAVADIPDGATIMFPGFGGVGAPANLIGALHRLGVKNLTGVSNGAGGTDGRMDVGTLVEAGQLKMMILRLYRRYPPLPHKPICADVQQRRDRRGAGASGDFGRAHPSRPPLVSAGSIPPPAWAQSWLKAKSTGRSMAAPTCWKTPFPPTTPSFGPGRPTPSETWCSGWPSATSTPSWPWPPP